MRPGTSAVVAATAEFATAAEREVTMRSHQSRDVAAAILDDLVELQIEGPATPPAVAPDDLTGTWSSPAPAVAEARVPVLAAADPDPDPGLDLVPELESVLSDLESAFPSEQDLGPRSKPAPEPEFESVLPQPQPEPIPSASPPDRPAAVPVPAAVARHTDAEVTAQRSLLAECGAVVRWLCAKASAGELTSGDIAAARSFLAVAGLPPGTGPSGGTNDPAATG